MRAGAFLIGAFLTLAACDPTLAPEFTEDACGARAYSSLIGEPRTVLDGIPFSQPVRIIPHDGAVTLDYNAFRLNFRLDRAGRIAEVTCG